MLYNRLANISNIHVCILTHYITHSSSIISTYPCEIFNDMITTTRSEAQYPIRTSWQPYHLIGRLNTAPEINKVIINIPFIGVGFSTLVLQTVRIHWKVLWWLPLMFFVDLTSDGRTECFWDMSWCCGILVPKWKWNIW